MRQGAAAAAFLAALALCGPAPAFSQGVPEFVPEPVRTRVLHPLDGTVYPADLRSPVFRWQDADRGDKAWTLRFSFPDAGQDFEVRVDTDHWTPERARWEAMKSASREAAAKLEIRGPKGALLTAGFSTSRDEVGAPIFFRAVPNPFPESKDFVKVKWKLGRVSSYDPPVTVMRDQPLCLNCHSASLDGKVFGFEFNPVGDESDPPKEDRAGYLLYRDPGRQVSLGWRDYFNWNDPLPESERSRHQAFVSIISPDGSTVVTGGKAMTSLALVPVRDLLSFSMVTKGILLCRSTRGGRIRALPGADDERFVHTPTSWSPDGRYIYFHRAAITPQFDGLNRRGLDPKVEEAHKRLGWRELDRIYPLRYDVYRIPFNGGRGGRAEPVVGASANGRSNYFAKASPDGKWLVFTRAANGVGTIREDSDLYIVPAEGGEARKLRSCGPWAESWHSWSPNSRWLVFSSKPHGLRTDLVLTHIDDQGRDSPPIILESLRDEDGFSANLPEFYNLEPGRMERIATSFPAWGLKAVKLWNRLFGSGRL